MNEPLFEHHLHSLFKILDDSSINKKEIKLRKKNLQNSAERIRRTETLESYSLFHQLAHEIESFNFLSSFGKVKISENCKSEKGCDHVLNNEIFIECVCSSFGDVNNNGLKDYLGEGLFDYNEKKAILNTRFTSSLFDKVAFYNERVGKSIPNDKPYVIFLGVGSIAYEWFAESFGMALLDILIGRGFPTLKLNINTNEVTGCGYTHNSEIKKSSGSPIDCNLFLREDFKCVSAIILSVAPLDCRYDRENTFLFINPNAKNHLFVKNFWGIVYWNENKAGYYTPRRKGKVIELKNGFT